jgi:hypothetical protein
MADGMPPVLAIDDDAEALQKLEKAFPGMVRALCLNSLLTGSGESYMQYALRMLGEIRPQVLVVDLRWYEGGKANDALRFLRQAADLSLLEEVTIIVWSRYLGDAERDLRRLSDKLLRNHRVRTIERVSKDSIPPLLQWVAHV